MFTFAVCGADPVRRHWHLAFRGTTLLAAGTAHAVLARTLYVRPPPGVGVAPEDLHQAAQWMYYGGDLVEAGMALLMGMSWYVAAGRAHARGRRPVFGTDRLTDGPAGELGGHHRTSAAGGEP
ncbi:cytochrome c oxidase assembly protein [Streptomyces sp. NPDC058642]|uniref:cytochrome c oxidase assembly protein n=1 Tax=Streptomyces sp. NPDC058642 TaxID=3346572 RepID=UPI00364A78D0